MKIIFVALLFAVILCTANAKKRLRCFEVTTSEPPTNQTCDGDNQVYSKCGANGCQNTCANPTLSTVCRPSCVPGCVCEEGYIRDDNGDCVDPDDCPGKPKECSKEHEVYDKCGSACPPTCDGAPDFCTEQCVQGCFCERGYVRNKKGDCVLPEECPAKSCPKNERWASCAGFCFEQRCRDLLHRVMCRPGACIPGCICEEGFYRSKNGNCISDVKCHKEICTEKNEEFSDCGGSPCQATCENPKLPMMCKAPCRSGCGCKDGYLRDPDGNCVRPKQCPKTPTCKKENEEYRECGSAAGCVPTCEKPNGGACTKQCVAGCFCQKGFLRNSDGDCVLPESCPVELECGENEEYVACSTLCGERTCKRNRDFYCGAGLCKPKCHCKKGFVRDDDDKCIAFEDCKVQPPTSSAGD